MEPTDAAAFELVTSSAPAAALLERRGMAGGWTEEEDVSKVAENFPGAEIVAAPAVVGPASVEEDDELLLAGVGASGCMVGGSAIKQLTNK